MSQSSLTALLEQYRNRYYALNTRDRIITNLTIAIAVITLAVLGLWKPAYDFQESAKAKYEGQLRDFAWIDHHSQFVKANTNSRTKGANQPMATVINQTTRRARIAFKRYEPQGDDKLRVVFENVDFNGLVQWMDSLSKQYAITATKVAIDGQPSAGLVNAKLTLER